MKKTAADAQAIEARLVAAAVAQRQAEDATSASQKVAEEANATTQKMVEEAKTAKNFAAGAAVAADMSQEQHLLFPQLFRSKHSHLLSTYDLVDVTGCRLIALSLRSDVGAVRNFSKRLYANVRSADQENYIEYCFLAHRLYDPACVRSVLWLLSCLWPRFSACFLALGLAKSPAFLL